MKMMKAVLIPALMAVSLSGCNAHTSTHHGLGGMVHHSSSVPSSAPSDNTANSGSNGTLAFSNASATEVQSQPAPNTCHYRYVNKDAGIVLPDPKCTPGALNPNVTQDNIDSTICKAGWTTTVRPTTSITNKEKALNAKSYGYTGKWSTSEYDHHVSLSLGGAPNDPRNLWVEPNKDTAKNTTNPKDAVEGNLRRAICKRKITLAAAQQAIASDWTTAEAKLGLKTTWHTKAKKDDDDD